MGTGKLIIEVRNSDDSLPIGGAHVTLSGADQVPLFETHTDANGNTEPLPLTAPDKAYTLDPNFHKPAYSEWEVTVTKPGFVTSRIHHVEVVDSQTSILPVHLLPLMEGQNPAADMDIDIPPMLPALPDTDHQIPFQTDTERQAVPALFAPANPHLDPTDPPTPPQQVFIPDYITVHLGRPTDTSARNVRVRFIDYIKNVASSEVYGTWPRNSLIANVHAIVTFALNRIYTEWYRSRGFNFDITNSTAFDQYYREGAQIFDSINKVVDDVFDQYVHRQGLINPFFTSFCSGTTATCNGLSQWGTVTLANQGRTPLEILRYYYPNDIVVSPVENVAGITESFPGAALRMGSTGDTVRRMQNYLNRIRVNFPLIPQIQSPNGTFGEDTAEAVRVFQRTFNLTPDGIIGRNTWNRIISIYTGVTRLAELDSQGHRYTIGETPPDVVLRRGSRGRDVRELQFLINAISPFFDGVPPVIEDADFDTETQNAVIDFQRNFDLTPDGVVGPTTWAKLYAVYRGIQQNRPTPVPMPTPSPISPPQPPAPTPPPPYPGTLLRVGSRGDDVRLIQTYLGAIRRDHPSIPALTVDGIFGPVTQSAVTAFQREFGLTPDGVIGPLTWAALTEQYSMMQ
ncbi:MAG: peptidoglycan-binding protein [Oscillospiraceae bacterium]|nr:peptidoglycan-binding protein [Oscillospiraceae bacterium]